MEEKEMLVLLEKIIWLIERNRFVEARRLVKQELENINGITEKKCKRHIINKRYCRICNNYNCNLNSNKSIVLEKSQIIEKLEEIKDTINTDNIEQALKNINTYIQIFKDKRLLDILNRLKLCLEKQNIFEAREYLMLEINNFKDITPKICKENNKYALEWYCKTCTNYNCSDNKNK